jgi:hypothetical protein
MAAMARELHRVAIVTKSIGELPEALLAQDGRDPAWLAQESDIDDAKQVLVGLRGHLDRLRKLVLPKAPRARPYHRRRKSAS